GYFYVGPWLASFLPANRWAPLMISIIAAAALGWFAGKPLNRILGVAFRAFNAAFDRSTGWYVGAVGVLLRVSLVVLLIYAGLLVLTYFSFTSTPTGFIPQQDKGYLLVNVQLPDSASLERTEKAMRQMEKVALETPGVQHTVSIGGQSSLLNANAPNFGSIYVMLEPFAERRSADLSSDR